MNSSLSNFSVDSADLKIAVLGKSLVGKSALTYRFINDKFPEEHDTTIEDQYSLPIEIEGIQCKLEILDTAGQDDYQSMLDTWINSVDGFILVYAIDDKESFESMKMRYERIVKNKGNNKYSIVIAGNKCDLENKRKVSREEGELYCKGLNIDFLECSALEKINVKECFLCVSKKLLRIKFPKAFAQEDNNKRKCFCF
jgi:small GTP-binding protein